MTVAGDLYNPTLVLGLKAMVLKIYLGDGYMTIEVRLEGSGDVVHEGRNRQLL